VARRPLLLGVAASLRNARWGAGTQDLVTSLKRCSNREELVGFLANQSELHLENFVAAGRAEGKPFTEIYETLRRNKGDKGLSNSEVALASALWSALNQGVDIDHISLSEYFLNSGAIRSEGILKQKLIAADGLIVSGPVYFGDRGSLAQSLVELIRADGELRMQLQGKVYAGIAVGAKRNGGQETTLIYQMLDFVNAGFWAVGNDTDETAQYGGTCYAGDVGTMHKDAYGLNTSMGTGRRVGRLIRDIGRHQIVGPVKVLFLILQDRHGEALRELEKLLNHSAQQIEANIINVADKHIMPCIACDICPTHIDVDEVYRCVISASRDSMGNLHSQLLHHDAIVPVILSSKDTRSLTSNYQTFMERTRYIRRGDYTFSNQLVAPLVFEEIGAGQNYALRIMTSMVRHNTVISKPMIGFINDGRVLNDTDLKVDFAEFVMSVRRLAAVRLGAAFDRQTTKYNPVGYVLAADKELEDIALDTRSEAARLRHERLFQEATKRLRNQCPDQRR
jgi:multimeric flavodoxin WrbA